MAFLDGGARFIQVRAKQMPSGALLDLCEGVVQAAAPYKASVIVNDRADIAAMSRAAGVHVGQDDLDPAAALALLGALLGPGAIVGYSTHTVAQVEAAVHEPLSYIAVGPVFGTRSKDTGYEAVGLEMVTAAARTAAGVPIVAIGGITLATAPLVIEAGASSVAVIGDLLAGNDPAARIADYVRILR